MKNFLLVTLTTGDNVLIPLSEIKMIFEEKDNSFIVLKTGRKFYGYTVFENLSEICAQIEGR